MNHKKFTKRLLVERFRVRVGLYVLRTRNTVICIDRRNKPDTSVTTHTSHVSRQKHGEKLSVVRKLKKIFLQDYNTKYSHSSLIQIIFINMFQMSWTLEREREKEGDDITELKPDYQRGLLWWHNHGAAPSRRSWSSWLSLEQHRHRLTQP